MATIAGPLDELFEWVDKIQGWLDANRLIREALDRILSPLFEFMGWVGQFAEMFVDAVTQKILNELKPIIAVIDAFFDAVNAVIDAIQAIIEALTNPIGALVDAIY
jgi:phage-related protein